MENSFLPRTRFPDTLASGSPGKFHFFPPLPYFASVRFFLVLWWMLQPYPLLCSRDIIFSNRFFFPPRPPHHPRKCMPQANFSGSKGFHPVLYPLPISVFFPLPPPPFFFLFGQWPFVFDLAFTCFLSPVLFLFAFPSPSVTWPARFLKIFLLFFCRPRRNR